MKKFDFTNKRIRTQFDNIEWVEESGLCEKELMREYAALMSLDGKESRMLIRAKTFQLICEKSRFALDKDDIFQDKLYSGNILSNQRVEWCNEIKKKFLPVETEETEYARLCGAYGAGEDFGHTSPNSKLLFEIGFRGLFERVEAASARNDITAKQKTFYESCKIALKACSSFILRLADGIEQYNEENAKALRSIAYDAPTNSYEAMQLLIVYFCLHQYVYQTFLRTLGRLDVLLTPFFERDIKNGTFTKAQIKEMLRFFLNKLSAAHERFGLPFCLGGIDENGNEVTNEWSYFIVEVYDELKVYSPKIHIRVSENTPAEFIKMVLNCIRNGISSFVFCNDDVAIRALMRVGVSEKDAKDYTPIGCYEPAVWGKEIGCTGNADVNLAKAVELVFTGGVDNKSGRKIGADVASLDTFEDFYNAVKMQIAYMGERCIRYVSAIEEHYGEIGTDPLHSAMYDESVVRGVDVYEGGAKYNNSSINFFGIATLVDSLTAIKKFVYEDKKYTIPEFYSILKNNWSGYEKLRLLIKKIPEKYGNSNDTADWFTRDISQYCASFVNKHPNGRGGVFKASLYSIDKCYTYGHGTMATPDGRFEGEALSKNLEASWAMDKKGILALITSVTKIDHANFPNGSVLGITLHPSAVSGDDGLEAFYGIVKTYLDKGGFAIHGNVFDADMLQEAQENPEKYSTLQVRVCGWNAYFVNLTKEEQDSFIIQARNAM